MFRKRWLLLVCTAAAIVPWGTYAVASKVRSEAGSYPATMTVNQPASQGAIQQGPSFASWANSYANVSDMAHASDAVVVARAGSYKESTNNNIVFTDFSMMVISAEKGKLAPGGTFVLHQTGGRSASGAAWVLPDDPLLVLGTDYLLFLKFDPVSGDYFVVGGPDGRLVVRGGTVSALSQVYNDRKIVDTGLSNKSLADVIAKIR